MKLQTWMLQSMDDANTDCENFYCAACIVSCNPKWLQTISLSSSYNQRTSGYCTPCASLWTSARQTDALSHGHRIVKLRHIMWSALNQWKGRILVRGVIIDIISSSIQYLHRFVIFKDYFYIFPILLPNNLFGIWGVDNKRKKSLLTMTRAS